MGCSDSDLCLQVTLLVGAKGLAKEARVSDLVSVANEEIEFYTETGEYSILIRT